VPKRIRAVKAAAINCVEDSLGSFGISDKTILLQIHCWLASTSEEICSG
jgi:hypothetical protein